jgi:ethanolamine ammonia-lyase small subunit
MNFDNYRRYTQARIGLAHKGAALATKDWLSFSFDHAQAIDAIAISWDLAKQSEELKACGFHAELLSTLVKDRQEFLLRPDLGKKLSKESKKYLKSLTAHHDNKAESIFIIATNGLSSLALNNHLAKFLLAFFPLCKEAGLTLFKNCIFLAANGRVGLIDDIGATVKPTIAIILIGERPGLSSPDSLAAYITFKPKIGRSDAERNCISNIRPPHGLSYEQASAKLIFLLKESLRLRVSGVSLKDDTALLSA